jgi:hypothetical protein
MNVLAKTVPAANGFDIATAAMRRDRIDAHDGVRLFCGATFRM